jgi:hypothetical protein
MLKIYRPEAGAPSYHDICFRGFKYLNFSTISETGIGKQANTEYKI